LVSGGIRVLVPFCQVAGRRRFIQKERRDRRKERKKNKEKIRKEDIFM